MTWVNKDYPSYYAVIPANVRYDKRLTANEKLLYGEITCLSQKEGYCWSTNKYFADLYDVDSSTVSRWISKLVKCGYIKTDFIYKENSKEIEQRRIYLCVDYFDNTYMQNNQYPIDKKINTPIDENVKDNNININNINNNSTTNIKEDSSSLPVLDSLSYKNNYLEDSKSAVMVRSQVLGAYPGELGEIIVKWYDAVGISRKITFKQIKDKLEKLQKDCNNDAKLVVQQINNSYLNGYPAWYPPRVTKNNNVFNSVSVRPGEVDKSGYRNRI